MNDNKFEDFPEDIQEILLDSAKEAGTFEREFVQKLESEYKETAIENGMEIIEDIDLEPFKEAVKPIYKKNEDKYGEMHKIIKETE